MRKFAFVCAHIFWHSQPQTHSFAGRRQNVVLTDFCRMSSEGLQETFPPVVAPKTETLPFMR